MAEIALRRAVNGDIATLRKWDEAPHVVAVSGDDGPWDWEAELAAPWQEVWITEVDGLPVGVVVLLNAHTEPSRYWGDVPAGTYAIDIWIGEEQFIGRGIGTKMMRHVIDRAFATHQAHTILIDPLQTNQAAIAFYRTLGFDDVGPRRFGADDCLVLRLQRPEN